jgi:hypothetical protein
MTTPPLKLLALVDNCSGGYCLPQLSAGFCNLAMPTVENPDTTRDRSAPPRYPGWATPLTALLSLGFLIAAVGGPGPVLSMNVSASVLIVAIASAVVAVVAVLVLERRTYSRRRNAQANRKPKAGGRTNSGWILGAILLTVFLLRMLVSTSPFVAAVIFGLFGGAGLAASAGFQWENRHPPPR